MTKEKKEKPQSNPFWLKWLVIAFVAYAAYLHFTGQGADKSIIGTREALKGEVANQAASEPADVTDGRVKVGGDITGAGEAARCGQKATVRVTGALPDGSAVETTHEPVTLAVGLPEQPYPWAHGVPGMKKGGVREVIVPAQHVYDEKTLKDKKLEPMASVQFKISLEELSPVADARQMPFRVVDAEPSKGRVAYCGDKVKIHLTLWGADGAKLYSSEGGEPLAFDLGSAAVFYGLDRGILGMREKAKRTLMIPPAYLVTFAAAPSPALAALPKDKIAVADVTLLDISKGADKE